MGQQASDGCVIHWFRRDLRLEDNDALTEAASQGLPLAPVFIIEPKHRRARASFWWLCRSLERLGADLAALGHKLIVLEGDPLSILPGLAKDANARYLAWSRTFEPADDERDLLLTKNLRALGLSVFRAEDGLLFAPEKTRNKAGAPFRVFTPFWRSCRQALPRPLRKSIPQFPPAASLAQPGNIDPSLLAGDGWARGFSDHWSPGELGAQARLKRFLGGAIDDYAVQRDRPDIQGTSRLSAHLHWGEIAPARILHEINRRHALAQDRLTPSHESDPELNVNPSLKQIGRADSRLQSKPPSGFDFRRSALEVARNDGVEKFLAELGWREFAYHLLAQFPEMDRLEFKPDFRNHPWQGENDVFTAWKKGRTGIPFIDAGLRELWATGWMHNRVRMVAASFLVKQLRTDWRLGLAWFNDTLVDADLANNAAGWQWVAGCGADAAPYFRVFNPVLQGQKFDPEGKYVRHWLPELAGLPSGLVHTPWLAGGFAPPIIDLGEGRKRALGARKSRP